ncbi:MAG: hypothetical protein JXQ72_06490 [Anaerolineae bacterium]|nr:hypothetical protein [Anaerolineae bacterium]
MTDQLPDVERDMPRVILAQRVIDKILRGALLYPEPETGEALIGLVVPQEGRSEPDIYVLDTIGPGEDAVREWGMFEQGNDYQADVFNWLHNNWEAFRELRRPSYGSALAAKWDVPLMHVGDWHKQPGDMVEPSTGDAQTAHRMISDSETPVTHLVAPIVTMYRLVESESLDTAASGDAVDDVNDEDESARDQPSESSSELSSETSPESVDEEIVMSDAMPKESARAIIKALPDDGWIVRMDFWYMSKRIRHFIELQPVVWPDDRLPRLPSVAWHLEHPHRFDQERDLLRENDYVIDVVRWDADGKPPYEICFSVYKPGSEHVIILVTAVDYPAQQPALRVAPLVNVSEDEDVFEKLYQASKPVMMTQMPEWDWDSKRTLVELVWHVEKTLDKGDGV